jgi:hypothetical protein
MFLVLMPVKEINASVQEIDVRKMIALKFELNERYFSPDHEAFFEICSNPKRADALVYLHKVSWN